MAPIRDILYWQERTRKAEERGDRALDELKEARLSLEHLAHTTAGLYAKVEALDAALRIATVGQGLT